MSETSTPAAVNEPAPNLPAVWTPQPQQDRRFWKKLLRVVTRISFAEDLGAAFYCAIDRTTPTYVRATLLAALAYFLLPTDTVPDMLAVLGFTDDAAVLAAALAAVGQNLRPEHREAARRRLDELTA
jgi:uncharacterized membrane protein YkvA (DUF1232 family)